MSDAVRLGIIGCGGIGGWHAKGYEELLKAGYDRLAVTAVCDVDEDKANGFAAKIEEMLGTKPSVFLGVEEMLAAGIVDAGDVCLPHAYHHTAALACLGAGVHVMVEKPAGITVKATRLMMEAAKGTDLVLACAEQIRRNPGARAIEWAINDQKMMGEPQYFTHEVFTGGPFDRSRPAFAWRSLKLLSGGGQILDGGAHFADMVQHIFGPADEVFCTMRTVDDQIIELPDVPAQPVDVEDYWTATIVFESGLIGHWGWSNYAWGQPTSVRTYYGTEGSFADRQEWQHPFEFGGDLTRKNGTAVPYEDIEAQYMISLTDEQKQRLFPHGVTMDVAIECWDFVDAIVKKRAPEVGAPEALQAKSLCFALYESATANAPVKVADVRDGKVSAYQEPIDEYWDI